MQCLLCRFCKEFDIDFVFIHSLDLRSIERSLLGKIPGCEEVLTYIIVYLIFSFGVVEEKW